MRFGLVLNVCRVWWVMCDVWCAQSFTFLGTSRNSFKKACPWYYRLFWHFLSLSWDEFSPPRQYNRKNLKMFTRTLSLYRYSAMNIVYTKIKMFTRTLSFIGIQQCVRFMFRVTCLPPIIYRYDFTPSKHSPNKSILKVKFELSRCSRLAHSFLFLLLYEYLLLLSHAWLNYLLQYIH